VNASHELREELRAGRTAPGPRGWEVLPTLLSLRRDPLAALADVRARWGPFVRIPLGRRSFFLVADPDAARRVLCDNARGYGKDTWSYNLLRRVLGSGLLTSEGEAWRCRRRLLAPAFHRSMLATLGECVVERSDAMLQRWRALGHGAVVDIGSEVTRLSVDVVARAILGTDIGTDAELVALHLKGALAHIHDRTQRPFDLPASWPTPGNERFRADVQALDAVVDRMIDARQREPSGGANLVATLLAVRDERGVALSRREIRDELKTFLLAGHETTATLLSWTLGFLARHPEIEAHVRHETRALLGAERPSAEHLVRLAYLRAVLSETLRLYPPLWLVERRATEADVLSGFHVARGSSVAVCQYLLHRDSSAFPEPHRFMPERFLSGQRPRGYLPFGAGSRRCIGDAFALMEAGLVTARIAQAGCEARDGQALRLELVGPELPEPAAYVTLRPREPIRMRVVLGRRGRS
jgi:cytochrome P450